ncbi:acetate kinase [Actinacidiphila bryophytorum]|uniref:Acetate kinase n=1 Tax=Actinacidiphila bryophytorum TaxID=1436133 RepID=A0A9W4E3B5_9ACTN|nr:acetate kinase [Actinacidiphila bryophytorum]MBM9435415.1 acetate kinase [Actinacidiphila bryophytorum]MBN6546567.1 acetate kinase [Actinacidiphila bryophytorum]CAG7607858.1 acetate kinase [Actinacidiphila bryophytorum]
MSGATRVLVLNSGSSSVKYQLIDMADEQRLASGVVERIGEPGGVPDHTHALREVALDLKARGSGLDSPDLAAVGHRVVHGGTRFTAPTLITDEVLAGIEELVPLAPLHNPANVTGIKVARELRPDLPQVAVFDTAFHSTLPEAAARYAIDTATADRYGIRRYGFHGTSHAYVSRATAALLGKEPADVNVIVLHLGNGASASAVRGGVCVDTSMGLTPLEGLVMGTRSGDLDPAVVFHLERVGGMGTDEIDTLLNKKSGLLGLCGANDMREIGRRMAEGDKAAQLAFDVYVHRLRRYVGAFSAVLGRVDAITFTAGVGENSAAVREAALSGLHNLGVTMDPVRNAVRGSAARLVSAETSPVAVAVVPTDEELEIARDTYGLAAPADKNLADHSG